MLFVYAQMSKIDQVYLINEVIKLNLRDIYRGNQDEDKTLCACEEK